MPTVDLGFLKNVFWSTDIEGERPSIESTSGLSRFPVNCLAYEDKDSIYLLCPSAKIVSKASDDLPDPLRPVITDILFLGISTSTFLRLFCLAPFILMKFKVERVYLKKIKQITVVSKNRKNESFNLNLEPISE